MMSVQNRALNQTEEDMIFKYTRLIYQLTLTVLFVVFLSERAPAQSGNSELKKLTDSSDLIVVGKVVKQSSQWNEDKTRIFTRVSVNTEEYLKGKSGQKQLTITKPGGEVGDVGELYSHVPEFDDDEEVLLFLKKDKENELVVNKGTQGKYTIRRNNASGIRMIGESRTLENYKIKIKSFVQE
jgi:hypothetical protein